MYCRGGKDFLTRTYNFVIYDISLIYVQPKESQAQLAECEARLDHIRGDSFSSNLSIMAKDTSTHWDIMSKDEARRWALPIGGFTGTSAGIYLLWQLVSGVNGLQSEFKEMRKEFSKANAIMMGISQQVQNQTNRLNRHGDRIETLQGYHFKTN